MSDLIFKNVSFEITTSGGSKTTTKNVDFGVPLEAAHVALAGWKLKFDDSDHHFRTGRASLVADLADPSEGTVQIEAQVNLSDKNSDDSYTADVWGLVIGVPA